MEIPIAPVGKGDVEHLLIDGIKVYTIPDYVYVEDGVWHILDWKSGKAKPEHAAHVCLYALWAHRKHGVPADKILLSLEYLQEGRQLELPVTAFDLEQVMERLHDSVQDMAQYLEEADITLNRALPKAEWDLCFDPELCSRCPFFELCEPELEGLFDGFSPDSDSSPD
jgi:CRISPR/Cas system-associated exonuclease Cas4 (RecB family)